MSLNLTEIIAKELNIRLEQAESTLELRAEGGTVPFIARYRKERTGELDETQIRNIFDRMDYLTELEDRKTTILKSIEEQGKLTDELKNKIEKCLVKTELEDLYLPYKPKKRTRATIAKEKGLEPLSLEITEANVVSSPAIDLKAIAEKYINEEKGVKSVKEAIDGASDIIAEQIAEKAEFRAWIRERITNNSEVASKIKDEFPEGTTKYEMYREFKANLKSLQPHHILALRRAENEGVLTFDFDFDEESILEYMSSKTVFSQYPELVDFYKRSIKDGYQRLMKSSIIGEVRLENKLYADSESINNFGTNLRQALLASPAGMKPTLAIDPGFRTGCKVSAIGETGKFLEYRTIFPHASQNERDKARRDVLELIKKHKIELIAIGNGTASRETDEFVIEILEKVENKPIKIIVSEAGASVYSASEVAIAEFPDFDLTIRGAISIGRRLQDPLAELVKIDPKSIGVGQYQHDVDQKLLKKKLDETIESCVNFVGVDLNMASKELLVHVAGINETVAKNIVTYRNENGAFKTRKSILKVPKFGPKAYEQAAGFLRIRNGDNVLDNTAVHPESYKIAEAIVGDLQVDIREIQANPEILKTINLKKYISEQVGEPTLRDIIAELAKPGRDPREEFKAPKFHEGIKEIKDLKIGMELEGVITNITNFGAFVDIGVHQDGLVHISQMSNQFVKDPTKVVKLGQIVKVKVLEVNVSLKRINLTMKTEVAKKSIAVPKEEPTYSINDLKAKFK